MQAFAALGLHFLLLLTVARATDDAPVAETELGRIIGKFHNVTVFGDTFTVERFLGIPYAEPPIGELRFQKPTPKRPFSEPYYATEFGNICYQMFAWPFVKRDLPASEDCLLLNIFAPKRMEAERLPVMIYIHGGAHMSGAANPFIADALAAYGEVIVVTINYRVSLWGFLSTGDVIAPGNYGFYDQHLAIKWVHDHISAFGGDPGNVTLFGESAGSDSTIQQSIFPGNAGLFQRAIGQSGSIKSLWVTADFAKTEAENLGKIVGCKNLGSAPLVDCLRNISGEVLFDVINDPAHGYNTRPRPYPFVPSISSDSDFLYEKPTDWFKIDAANNLQRDRLEFFASLDLLIGFNSAEGALFIDPSLGEPNRTYFENHLVPTAMKGTLGSNIPDLAKFNVLQTYTDWENPTDAQKRRHNFMRILSDSVFATSIMETAKYHASIEETSRRTFFYLFDVVPSERLLRTPDWVDQANHADELGYLFFGETDGVLQNLPGHEGYTPEPWESDVAKYMITMWSNFAKTGFV